MDKITVKICSKELEACSWPNRYIVSKLLKHGAPILCGISNVEEEGFADLEYLKDFHFIGEILTCYENQIYYYTFKPVKSVT